jgi:chemotaxis protein CheD
MQAQQQKLANRRGSDPYTENTEPGCRKMFDERFGKTAVRVPPGMSYVTSDASEMVVTILGSCVAACIRDPETGCGGLNHFMLPESDTGNWNGVGAAMRYGNHAMEALINEILKSGCLRENLEIKLFGGSTLAGMSSPVGQKNGDFALRYLEIEGLRPVVTDLGGAYPRRIHYFPETGRVKRLVLRRGEDTKLLTREMQYQKTLSKTKIVSDIELFD